eukprot:TRINITY_DN19355_c0_g1_i1.p2 TRINITY_DN19355_c0_g1~~TRINITY_DN19355_c0_g1_i1.p2  ORF type:complete len:118 (-),score=15.90 TRINITY_DN19355_c0_g1_i1:651-1004(-)
MLVSDLIPDHVPASTSRGTARRGIKWQYLIPITGAPTAHMLVSMLPGLKKTPRQWRWAFTGVLALTASMVSTRLILMEDAGFSGEEFWWDKPRDVTTLKLRDVSIPRQDYGKKKDGL